MTKIKIEPSYPIIKPIADRWSPRAFSNKSVSKEDLLSIFEAAKWAASCFNEQPWRFKVGFKGDDNYKRIFDTLGEFNQNWVKTAPVVVLIYAKKTFTRNGKPNAHFWYDTGQAVGNLSIQASSMGLYLHQMAGFDKERAEIDVINDEDYEAIAVMAMGYLGDVKQLPESLQQSEYAAQQRRSVEEFVSFD